MSDDEKILRPSSTVPEEMVRSANQAAVQAGQDLGNSLAQEALAARHVPAPSAKVAASLRVDGARPRGFVYIGDQHLSVESPGRRRPGYIGEIMRKIAQAIHIANHERAVPLFGGDLFDEPSPEGMTPFITALNRILATAMFTPIFVPGNHDKSGVVLSDSDLLSNVATGGLAKVANTNGPAAIYTMEDGRTVLVGVTPYGMAIPGDLTRWAETVDGVVWLTHHDLAFNGAYPGATELFPIPGCDVVMNGHMHGYQDPVMVGDTVWCNFGSICRQSIDMMGETPSVVMVAPEAVSDAGAGRSPMNFAFTRHLLKFMPAEEAFDLTGRNVTAARITADDIIAPSAFVAEMGEDIGGGVRQSDSGAIIRDHINERMAAWKSPPMVRCEVNNLLNMVVNDIDGATHLLDELPGEAAARQADRPEMPMDAPERDSLPAPG